MTRGEWDDATGLQPRCPLVRVAMGSSFALLIRPREEPIDGLGACDRRESINMMADLV